MKKRRRAGQVRWGIVAALVAALILTYSPIDTSFDVTAETESLRVTLSGMQKAPRWFYTAATLVDGDQAARQFAGSLELSPGANVQFERIQEGPLQIRVEHSTRTSAGTLYDERGQEIGPTASRVVLTVSDFDSLARKGQAVVMPFVGIVRLARPVGRETSATVPLLRHATLRMLGSTWGWGTRFDSGSIELETGDSLVFDPDTTEAVGIIRVSTDAGMTAVLRAIARAAIVSRFGAEGYRVQIPLLSRLKNDPLIQLAWTTFLFLVGLHQVIPHEKSRA